MSRTTQKYLGGGIILLSAIGYLAYAGMKEGWSSYHFPVDEFVAKPEFHNQHVRLAGTVAEEGVESHPGKLTASFTLLGEKERIPVVYTGVIPDLFKGGVQVVLEGRRDASGTFRADKMMTKCASKYESEEHGKK